MVDTVALTQEDLTKLQENIIDSLKDEICTVDIRHPLSRTPKGAAKKFDIAKSLI